VFENRIFGPNRDKVTGEWRKLHNQELHDLVILTEHDSGYKIKEYKIGWACGTNGKINAYRVLAGEPEGNRPLGRIIYERIILKRISRKYDRRAWTGLIWRRTQTSVGC
jgi:hypothetical protein